MVYTIEKGIINTKAKLKKLGVGVAAITMPLSIALFGSGAFAAVSNNYTLSGDASVVSPGNGSTNAVEVTSSSTGAGYGSVDYADPSGITVADLNTLSTDYQMTENNCGGGSPRFVINVNNDPNTNIFVYLGDYPDYTSCATTWTNTGNLLTSTSYVDTSQLGGTFYDTWGNAQTNYGTDNITGLSFVADGYWSANNDPQTVQIDNTQFNDTTYDYESAVVVNEPTNKKDCKHGGWVNYTDAQGNPFENQGQCVAYVNGGGTHVHNVTKVTNNNDIDAFNFNAQHAHSGWAVVKNNTTGGNAHSGDATNNNSSNFNIVVSNY